MMTQDTQPGQQRWVQAVGTPPAAAVNNSKERLMNWYKETAPVLYGDTLETPVGRLALIAHREGVCAISYSGDVEMLAAELEPGAQLTHDPAMTGKAVRELAEYFDGQRDTFDVALDYRYITPFQRRVLDMAQRIPAGSMWTYHDLAKALNKPKASRAVGQALAKNPIPIILPCHRVIGSDGHLRGYAGGLERKRKLLTLEGAI